jgi:hypothetical protein
MSFTQAGTKLPMADARSVAVQARLRMYKAKDERCFFPAEQRWEETRNHWAFGWSPNLKTWVATNGRGNAWAFSTKDQLLQMAEHMARNWNWCAA